MWEVIFRIANFEMFELHAPCPMLYAYGAD